jgi:hypothetical protein
MTAHTQNPKMTPHLEPLSVTSQTQIKGGMATMDEEKSKKATAKIS